MYLIPLIIFCFVAVLVLLIPYYKKAVVTEQRKPDISKAKEILNWEPKVNRSEGLKITYEAFNKLSQSDLNKQEHRDFQKFSKK